MHNSIRRLAAGATAMTALGLSGAAASPASAASAAPAASPRCTPSQLAVWVNAESASGAAGSVYYNLEFTNTGSVTCHLRGYPGVSAVDSDRNQLGEAASRDSSVPATTVNIAPGETAHAVLRYIDVVTTGPGCKPTPASYIRAIPPDETGTLDAFFSLPACTATGPSLTYLQIQRIQPGV